jgi:hypothetical protein
VSQPISKPSEHQRIAFIDRDTAVMPPLASMRLDLVHPAVEKVTLVLEGIGDDKVRVNSSSLDHPLVVLGH